SGSRAGVRQAVAATTTAPAARCWRRKASPAKRPRYCSDGLSRMGGQPVKTFTVLGRQRAHANSELTQTVLSLGLDYRRRETKTPLATVTRVNRLFGRACPPNREIQSGGH